MKYHFVLPSENIDTYFDKDESDFDKYIVVACAKNENDYIVEWVDHHLSVGFDKVIIADNNDDDSLYEILADHVNRGVVQILNCHGFKHFQWYIYQMFLRDHNYAWCAYIDADEFIQPTMYTNIKDFLATIEEDCVCINWLMYGPCGNVHKPTGGVLESYKYPMMPINEFKENMFVKCIVRGCERFENSSWSNHIPTTNEPTPVNVGGYFKSTNKLEYFYPYRYKMIHVKHFYTKSRDEWHEKCMRGWPDNNGKPKEEKIKIFENNNLQIDYNKYELGLFIYDDLLKVMENDMTTYNEYRTIELIVDSVNNLYYFAAYLVTLLRRVKDKVIIVRGDCITDEVYNFYFECGLKTGNRVIYSDSSEKTMDIFMNNKLENETSYFYKTV